MLGNSASQVGLLCCCCCFPGTRITWKRGPVCESLMATWLPVSSVCIHLHHGDNNGDKDGGDEYELDNNAVYLPSNFLIN